MLIEARLSLTRKPSGRLESAPCGGAVAQAQRRLMAVVVELVKLDHELHEICQTLPLAIDQGAMEVELVAPDVALWLHTTLATVKRRALSEAIERLREASQRTEADQRFAFYEGRES